jgi:hypothetical protein
MAETNSTSTLIKLVTQAVSSSAGGAKTKISKSEAARAAKKAALKSNTFKRRVAYSPSTDAINRMTVNNKISDSAIDASPLGSDYIQGKTGTALADAPSVGANVTARLNRLSQSVEPKIQKIVAGLNSKLNKVTTTSVPVMKTYRRKR